MRSNINSNCDECVPTAHYHLSPKYVLGIVFVGLCIGLPLFVFFFQEGALHIPEKNFTVIHKQPTDPTTRVNEQILSDSTMNLIYPPEYEMVKSDEPLVGSLAFYTFKDIEEADKKEVYPRLVHFSLYTNESIQVAGEKSSLSSEDFKNAKNAYESKGELASWQTVISEERLFYVQNKNVDRGTIRKYFSYFGDTRVEIDIMLSSPSQSMQADELFKQVLFGSAVKEGEHGLRFQSM